MYEDPNDCSACGGRCCKRLPGITYPEDFGLPDDTTALVKALQSGRWCLDSWEGDAAIGTDAFRNRPRTYFVRPAMRLVENGRRFADGRDDICAFLTDTGCELQPWDRPAACQCRAAKSSDIGKWSAAIAWIPYEQLLERIMAAALNGWR